MGYGSFSNTGQNGATSTAASVQLAVIATGGTGSEGAYSCSSGTCTITSGVHNYTTFTVSAGATVTVSGTTGATINATDVVTVNGLLSLNGGNGIAYGGGNGGSGGGNGGSGANGSGGNGTATTTGGGTGGSYSGYGGGGSGASGSYSASGNSGGSYSGGGSSSGGNGGGGGGGKISIITANQIVIGSTGAISANGGYGNGFNTYSSGGGGGGGGLVTLTAPTISNSGAISANGGGGGGGGGGGVVITYTNSGTIIGNNPTIYSDGYRLGASGTVFKNILTSQYPASGTYTSYIDVGGGGVNTEWNNFSWTQTSATSTATISYKLVGTNSASAPSFASPACTIAATNASGSFTPSGACATALAGYRYLWYQATLTASADLTQTPTLDSVTANATVSNYVNSGVYTSGIINTLLPSQWNNLSWTSSNGQTISLKVRTSNDPAMTGATYGASTAVSTGVALSTLGTTNGHQYIQYQATLSTTDPLSSPSLDSVTIGYSQYATSSYVISNAFNTSDAANTLAKMQWSGTTPGTSVIKFQLATSTDNIVWGNFAGPDGLTTSFFTAADGSQALSSAPYQNSQWFKYKTYLLSDGSVTPTLTSAITTYVVNAPPTFDATYGTNGVVVSQSSATDATLGKILLSYKVKDVDGNTGSGVITPSFEYSTTSGATWFPITAGYLGASDQNNITVDTVSYATGNMTWDTKGQLGSLYSSTAKIRVSAFDGQPANATTSAVSALFSLDSQNPVGTGLTFDAGVGGQTNSASVTINRPTDNNPIQYLLSDGTNSVGWTTISSTTTIPWTFDATQAAKSISLQLRDNYGNITASTTYSSSEPTISEGFFAQDISKQSTSDWKEYIAWSNSTSSDFVSYKLEYATSTNGTTYGNYVAITGGNFPRTDINTNFFVHSNLTGSLPTASGGFYYRYRISVINTAGNTSVRTVYPVSGNAYVTTRPDGAQNYDEGGTTGGSGTGSGVGITAPTVQFVVPTQSVSNGTVSIQYQLSDPLFASKNPLYEGHIFYNTGVTIPSALTGVITSIPVSDSSHMPASGFIELGNEVIQYTGNSNNVLSGLTRGTWPTTGTTRQTVQSSIIFQGTPVWILASLTSPVSIATSSALTAGQFGTLTWNTQNETALAGASYPNVGVRALIHDNQALQVGPISSQSAQSTDGTLTSLNMSAPTVAFATSSASVLETDSASTTATIALSRTYPLPVSISYTVDPASTGVLNTNYTMASTTGIITIPSGATSTTLTLSPVHDLGFTGDKTVVIHLSAPTNATIGANATYTYTIGETDLNPVVTFASASSTVSEMSGTTTIAVSLSYPSNVELVIPVTVAPTSTAIADINYGAIPGTLTISAGTTTASITVVALHNPAYGPDKMLTLTLGAVSGMVLGTTTSYTLNITEVDNAAPEVASVIASQVASSTDTNFGKVTIDYTVRDTNTNSGTITPTYVTPSFEYNTGLGWNAITTIRAEDVTNKSVSEDVFAPYTAVWDAQAQLGSVSIPNIQIRVTANDNESLNTSGTGTSIAFAIDRQAPQIGQFKFDARTGILTISITDSNPFTYIVSNNSDYSADGLNATSGISELVSSGTLAMTSAWSLATSSYPSIYITVTDALGNNATSWMTIPGQPQDFAFNDTSDTKNGFFKELISWLPYVSTSSAPFATYDIYRSVDGGEFALLTTKNEISANYIIDTGLASSSSYTYKMTITDTYGNVSQYSESVTDTPDGQGQTDLVAPVLSAVSAATVRNTSATITWTTDEISDSLVRYSLASDTTSYRTATSSGLVTDHSVVLTDLLPNTDYSVVAQSTDPSENASELSAPVSFTTTGGPVITTILSVPTDRSVTITWDTNKDSNSIVVYSKSSNFNGFNEVVGTVVPVGDASTTNVFAHTVAISGLDAGATFYYTVKSADSIGNESIDDNNGAYYTFRTLNDIYPPVISDISVPLSTPQSIMVFWKTDESATSQVGYDQTSTSTFANATPFDSTLSVYHSVVISGLTANTSYNYQVRSRDAFGNEAVSTSTSVTTAKEGEVKIITVGGGGAGVGQFTTPPEEKDTTPPVIANIEVATTTPFGVTITFTTSEPTVTFIEYGKDTTYGDTVGSQEYGQQHTLNINGLKIGGEYHFRIKAIDKSSNSAASEDQTFKTKFLSQASTELKTVADIKQYEQEIAQTIESILPGILPPFVETAGVTDITENSATVTWRTNISTYGVVSYATQDEYTASSTAGTYTGQVSDVDTKKASHTLLLVGLTPNTQYHFKVKSFSLPQVVGEGKDMTFTTKAAKVSARIIGIKNSSFNVVWTTDAAASTIVEYKNIKTGEIQRKIDNAKVKEHDMVIDKLLPATTYEVTVFGYNENNNLVESGAPLSVTTVRDITAPKIASFKVDGALVPGRTDRVQTVITWTTDEPSNSTIYYQEGAGAVTKDFANKSQQLDTYTTNHAIILSSLKPGTIYQMKVESSDQAGNKASFGPRTIITPQQGESIFDVIFKNFEDTFKFLRGAGQ